MAPLSVHVPCDPALFAKAGAFNCDVVPLADVLHGCQAVLIDAPDGASAAVAWKEIAPGVVELSAVQGQGGALKWLSWLEMNIQAHALRLVTQRRGLIRELGKRGYSVAGVILQKALPNGRQQH